MDQSNGAGEAPQVQNGGDSDAYNRLYSLAKKREEKLQAKRSQAPPGCTFSPQLKSRRPKTAGSGKNRYETLYENAKRISAKREAKLKSLESEYSFRPQLQTKAKVNRKGNVYDALYEKAKAQETKRREKEAMMASEYTFSPRINKSRSAEKLKTPVIERLYRKDYIASKMDAWEKARAARELEGCTFLPRTNGKQEREKLGEMGKAVFDKLYSDYEKIQEKISSKRAEKEHKESSGHSFRPNLDLTRHAGVSQNIERNYQGRNLSAHERLYGFAAELAERRSKLEDNSMKECTFHPQLSARSAAVVSFRSDSGAPRFEDLYLKGTQKQLERSKQEYNTEHQWDDEDERECTFRPNTVSSSEEPRRTFYTFADENLDMYDDESEGLEDERDRVQSLPSQNNNSGSGFVEPEDEVPVQASPSEPKALERSESELTSASTKSRRKKKKRIVRRASSRKMVKDDANDSVVSGTTATTDGPVRYV